MSKRWILVASGIVSLAVAIPLAVASTSGGAKKAKTPVRDIYLSAVEWKGSATVSKEPYPTNRPPSGGGYALYPAGSEKAKEETGKPDKWLAETYRFDSAVVVACAGEQVRMHIYGINAPYHDIVVPDFNKQFRVKRGIVSNVSFTVTKPGIYSIICVTHPPSHRADLAVFRKGSGPC